MGYSYGEGTLKGVSQVISVRIRHTHKEPYRDNDKALHETNYVVFEGLRPVAFSSSVRRPFQQALNREATSCWVPEPVDADRVHTSRPTLKNTRPCIHDCLSF